MQTTTSRRALLKAAPMIAATAAMPAMALTIPTSGDRSAWEAALRTMEQARADDAAFTPIHTRISKAWEASRPSMDGIDWTEFPFTNRDHVARTLDLNKAWHDFLASEGKTWFSRQPEVCKARYRAALDSVRAFRDAEARHDRESGMEEADERWEELGKRVNEAESALMHMPAPDLAALRWKLDQALMIEGDSICPWSADYVRQTVADFRRLCGEAA